MGAEKRLHLDISSHSQTLLTPVRPLLARMGIRKLWANLIRPQLSVNKQRCARI